MEIGALRPGARAADVVPAARAGAETVALVAETFVDVVDGAGWIRVRISVPDTSRAEEDQEGRRAALASVDAVRAHAEVRRWSLLRRMPKGIWQPIAGAEPQPG